LLRVFGRVASCCPTASFGPGNFELTHPVLLFSADFDGNIQAEYQMCWIVKGGDDTARLFLEDHERRRRNVIHILAEHGSAEIKTQAEAMVEDTPG
jgi:hypothetical protein